MFYISSKYDFNTLRLSALAAFVSLGFVAMQAAVGYPVGQLYTDLPKVSPFGVEDSGEISAAMMVDPGLGENATSLKLTGIRIGLTSRLNISEVTVWATYSLDEVPFAEIRIEGDVVKGWNDVDFPEPVGCDNRPFYIGYTLKTAGPSFPIAVIEGNNPASPQFWLNDGDGWTSHDSANDGSLAICAIIDGEGIPLYDLAVKSADVPRMLNSREGSTLQLELLNAGSKTVGHFSIKAREGEDASTEREWRLDQKIEPNRRGSVSLNFIPVSPTSMVPTSFSLEVCSIEEGEDENPADNVYTFEAAVSPYSFEKRLLVEEYTSEYCSNCPNAASMLHESLETEGYSDRVLAVCHHSGFQDDGFTLPCDKELIVLYGGSTYAPAMSFDRTHQTSSSVISHVPGSVKEMLGVFDKYLGLEAQVDLEANGEFSPADNTLNVKIEGMTLTGIPSDCINAVTVYLLEDDVDLDKMQLGADLSFRHQHVIRAYNSTWGDPIEWNADGTFEYEGTLNVPSGLRPENLSLVAFASKHDDSNLMDCEIANSVKGNAIDWTGYDAMHSVSEVESVDVVATSYLTPTGLPATATAPGVVLKVETLKNGERRVSKIIN